MRGYGSVEDFILIANQSMVAFTLGLGSQIWRKLRCRLVAHWICRATHQRATETHINAVLHALSWLMPVSYVLFVAATFHNDNIRRTGTLFYQVAIIYLMYIVFKALDRRRPYLLENSPISRDVDHG